MGVRSDGGPERADGGFDAALLDALPVSLYVVDRELRVVDWNRLREQGLYGLPREQAVGRALHEVLPEAGFRAAREALLRVFEAGAPHEETVATAERLFHCRRLPVFQGRQVTHVVCWFEDVTEQRRAQERLLLQGAALQAAADAIVITDLEGRVQWLNPAFSRLTGYPAEEVVGRNLRLLKSGVHDAAFYGELWRTILAGETWQGEITNRRKDGGLCAERQTITPVRDADGRLSHFVAIKRDISRERALDEHLRQTQRMEAVGRLAGGVAHDFNNLLGIIQGQAQLLKRALEPADPRTGRVEQVLKAVERAAALTRQLLAASRRQVSAPRVLDLNPILRDAQPLLRSVVGDGIQVELRPGADLGRVRADSGQVIEVLVNLAGRARDVMPQGGRLGIETSNADFGEALAAAPPGRYVMLAVSDTGRGMDAETQAHAFEPFFPTQAGGGTGLGMTTVYGIVKQNGGYISLSSEPGRGATFRIYLPRVDDAAAEPAASPAPSPSPAGGPRAPAIILLVDDEEALRLLSQEMLEVEGYKVLAAANGTEALSLADRHQGPIDLLLTDVVMPGMGGRELAERLAQRRPGLRVLFMSGYTGDAIFERGGPAPGVDVLQKPFSDVSLTRRVREALG